MNMLTLGEVLGHQHDHRPDEVAMIYAVDDRKWTFKELDREACKCANALQSMGVGNQDRVAYLDKNLPEYFSYLFGTAKLNAVTVPVNWRLAPPEMEYIINDSDSKILLIGEEFLPMLTQMTLDLEHIIVLGDVSETSYLSYLQWIEGQPDSIAISAASPDDICFQLYTSGTTGLPKGVETTHSNMFAMNNSLSELGYSNETVSLVCMPLFHIAGNGWAIASFIKGAKIILMKDVDVQEILQVIPKYEITHTVFVPAVLQFLLMQPNVGAVNFSSLEVILYGASPISEKVLKDSIRTFQCEFFGTYGLTETTGGVTKLGPEDHASGSSGAKLLRSCGQVSNGHEIKIMDTTTGEEITDGRVGEIWIRGPQIMRGYWKDEQATADAIDSNGWLRSGDAGYMQEGYVYIHDRLNDMIVSGGENIYPVEIENILMQHSAVADVAIIGVPDDKWGETVKALVCKADESVTEDELMDYCREYLAHYKCPTSIEWVKQLPRNPSGKILKKELRRPYWKGAKR